MADTTKNETPHAAEQPPVAARRGWLAPLITAILVAVALVVGGVGGFAIANVTQPGGNAATEPGPVPHVDGQQGPQGPQGPRGSKGPNGQHGGPQQGPQGGHEGPRDGERPDRPQGPEQQPEGSTEG